MPHALERYVVLRMADLPGNDVDASDPCLLQDFRMPWDVHAGHVHEVGG